MDKSGGITSNEARHNLPPAIWLSQAAKDTMHDFPTVALTVAATREERFVTTSKDRFAPADRGRNDDSDAFETVSQSFGPADQLALAKDLNEQQA
ncbi:MAG TPA: hypothetical protein VLS27_02650 [Gammaproteobacteria bacterium]|nr:hypothetical protein [Gammaproteobacteria bacterium]